MIRLWCEPISLKNEWFAYKNSYFCIFLTVFFIVFPLFLPKRESLLFAQSLKNSDRVGIFFVALYKRAMSDSLRLLMTQVRNEWLAHDSSKLLSKISDSLKKIHFFPMFLTVFYCFHLFMPKSERLTSLFAQSLFTKEWPLAIRSGCLWHKSDGSDLLFHKRFSRKTDERIPNSVK